MGVEEEEEKKVRGVGGGNSGPGEREESHLQGDIRLICLETIVSQDASERKVKEIAKD